MMFVREKMKPIIWILDLDVDGMLSARKVQPVTLWG